jgi:DNA-binding NarL/FixJ family response regulator
VAVLDLQLPDGTGIEVCRKVRAVDPGISCLILTGDEDPEARRGAFEAGAAGFLLKQLQSSVLVEAIRRAAVGEVLFDPRTFYRGAPEPEAAHRDPRLRDLTVQERRVLDLLAAGLTNRQISAELSLAEKTVKNYVSSVLAKLGLRSRTQAALYIAHPQRGR